MKLIKSLIILIMLTGCGMKHKVEGKVEGNANVNVRHYIDFSSLTNYFREQCRIKLSEGGYTPTQSEVDECVSDAVFKFLDALSAGGV